MAFSAEDIVPDSPTNNFCTLNALYEGQGGGSGTLSEGNLKWSTTSGHRRAVANIAHGSKFYVEYVCNANGGPSNVHMLGFVQISNPTGTVNSMDLYFNNYTNGSHTNRVNGSNTTVVVPAEYVYTGDVIGLCIDPETGYGWYSINGDWKQNGNPSTGTNPVFVNIPSKDWTVYNYNANNTGTYNFGQDPTFAGSKNTPATVNINGTNVTGPFAPSGDAAGTAGLFYYPPPAGAKALNTANLPDFTPDVTGDVPQDYFKTVLYTGQTADSTFINNGDGTWSKTGVGFQPDLTVIKMRSSDTSGRSPVWTDAVRQASYSLLSDATDEEVYNTTDLSAFISDGFSVGNNARVNGSSKAMVAWCWKAGGSPSGSTSTTGSAKRINTSGTQDDTSCSALATAATNAGASNVITPTLMSINQAAGFSIFKVTKSAAQFSYDTYPHGLSKAPDFIISKSLDSTDNWYCFHRSINPNTGYSARIQLNQPNQATVNSSLWGTPTNITDNIVAWDGLQSIENIFYCWHSVENYSKFGSYTGNGSPDGPFVYCGFRPAFVICKRTDSSTNGHWIMMDSARKTYNVIDSEKLFANSSAGESSFLNDDTSTDFLSNGFKVRGTYSGINASSSTYIFMAFAEQPFKFSNAR